MTIPYKMSPIGDFLEFPLKENLVAYYKDGALQLMPGKSIDSVIPQTQEDVESSELGPTIVILPDYDKWGDVAGGVVNVGITPNLSPVYTEHAYYVELYRDYYNPRAIKLRAWRGINNRTENKAYGANQSPPGLFITAKEDTLHGIGTIYGVGVAYAYADNGTTNIVFPITDYSLTSGTTTHVSRAKACYVFDRVLSKEEFDKVAEWIRATMKS